MEKAAESFFQLLVDDEELCEPDLLNGLREILKTEGLPSSESDTIAYLARLRSKDRLDDVVLYPLWKAAPTWGALGYASGEEISPAKPAPLKKKDRLAPLFRGANSSCPTQAWHTYLANKKREEKKTYRRETIAKDISAALDRGFLTPSQAAWFMGLYQDRADDTPYPLNRIFTAYKTAKDFYADTLAIGASAGTVAGAPRSKTSYSSEKIKKTEHTRRMGLYVRYSGEQIIELSDLMVLYQKIAFAPQAALVYRDNDGKEIYQYPIEGQDVFDSASLVLRDLVTRTQKKKSFENVAIEFDDLVLAGLETGAIDGALTEQALKIDELWNPQMTTKEKLKKWARRVLGPTVILIPPPFNMIASMALVLSEQFLLKSDTKEIPIFPGTRR